MTAEAIPQAWTWASYFSSLRLRALHEAAHSVAEEVVGGHSEGAYITLTIPDAEHPTLVGGEAPWTGSAKVTAASRAVVSMIGVIAEAELGGRDTFVLESDAGDARTLKAAIEEAGIREPDVEAWLKAPVGEEALAIIHEHHLAVLVIGGALLVHERVTGEYVRWALQTCKPIVVE